MKKQWYEKRIVLTYGTFDMLHIGHINLLRRAKALGHFLIVGLSTDRFNKVKGKISFFRYEDRKKILSSLKFVDMIIPETCWGQKIKDVIAFEVDVFVIGDDWRGKFDFLKQYCEVKYLPRTKNISTYLLKKKLAYPLN